MTDSKKQVELHMSKGKWGLLLTLVLCLLIAGCSRTGRPISVKVISEETDESKTPEEAEKPELIDLSRGETDPLRALSSSSKQNLASSAELFPTDEEQSATPREYTVMIYMIGSNLESRNGAASADLREIEASGIDYENSNVIVFTGGSRRWVSNVPGDCNNVLDMSLPEGARVVARTGGIADMGDPGTLSAFLNYTVEHYPANHYALIFWDHGGGPLYGYGADELWGNDSLLLSEIQTALDATVFAERKLDWAGFDACLMGSLEVASFMRAYTDRLVVSEETEPGAGWDYRFLSSLNETNAGDADQNDRITTSIVEYYGSYYEEAATAVSNPDYTLAVLDLTRIQELVDAFSSLAEEMSEALEAGDYARISRVRTNSRMMGIGAVKSREEGYDLLDIRSLADRLSTYYPEASAGVLNALEDIFICRTTNVEENCCLSIYFPGDNSELYTAAEENGIEISGTSEAFSEFTRSYAACWFDAMAHAPEVDWTLPDLTDNGEEYILHLSQEQLTDMKEASYTVLVETYNAYAPIMTRVKLEPDDQGVLHIPKDPTVFCGFNGFDNEGVPWVFAQTDIRHDSSVYQSYNLYLNHLTDLNDPNADIDEKISLSVSYDGEQISILSAAITDDDVGMAGKNTVDISAYNGITVFYGYTCYPTYNNDSRILSWNDWGESGTFLGMELSLDESFRIEPRNTSTLIDPFILQVEIIDSGNKHHGTNIVPAGEEKHLPYEIQEIPTAEGQLQAAVYEDHAEIRDYEGTDPVLEIPAYISNVPVTSITSRCFHSCKFEQIILPETLKKIGRSAFYYCDHLQSVTLPAGIEYVGDNAFVSCSSITSFAVDGISDTVKAVDGVLFSADGKTLRMYPNAKGTDYSIPEGTERIGYGAFARTDIRHVEFPSTLKEISTGAFFSTDYISGLVFPESLERIGTAAFSSIYTPTDKDYLGNPKYTETIELRIGPKVSIIGKMAFYGLADVEAFIVDPENHCFGSVEGFLTNEAEDTILTAPFGMSGCVKVPEGIVSLDNLAFKAMPKDSEYYLPDSLIMIPVNVFPHNTSSGDSSAARNLILHCSEGSAPETYAMKYELPYDHELTGHYEYEWKEDGSSFLFTMHTDYAVLTSFETELTELTLPDTVNGVPVTAIGDGNQPVYNGKTLSVLYIPDTVTCINHKAFYNCSSLTEVILPEHLEKFHPSAFARCSQLHTLLLSDTCEHFRVIDGVLFDFPGSRLIFFPAAYHAEQYGLERIHEGSDDPLDEDWDIYTYMVPEGTEVIGTGAFRFLNVRTLKYRLNIVLPESVRNVEAYAFADCDRTILKVVMNEGLEIIDKDAFYNTTMSEVRLPGTLKEIGTYAFYYSIAGNELILPDALEYIGNFAFRKPLTIKEDEYPDCHLIHIGKSMRAFEPFTFCYLYPEAFEVDEENPYFSSSDGFLLNKDGTVFVLCPSGLKGSIHVPEGVSVIDNYSFEECMEITDVYLPDSVTTIATYAFDNPEVVLHCRQGSYADQAAQLLGLTVEWE